MSSKAVMQRLTENERWENSTPAREMSLDSTTETMALSPTPAGMGMLPLGGLAGAWGVVVSRSWRWMEALPVIETSVKLL